MYKGKAFSEDQRTHSHRTSSELSDSEHKLAPPSSSGDSSQRPRCLRAPVISRYNVNPNQPAQILFQSTVVCVWDQQDFFALLERPVMRAQDRPRTLSAYIVGAVGEVIAIVKSVDYPFHIPEPPWGASRIHVTNSPDRLESSAIVHPERVGFTLQDFEQIYNSLVISANVAPKSSRRLGIVTKPCGYRALYLHL